MSELTTQRNLVYIRSSLSVFYCVLWDWPSCLKSFLNFNALLAIRDLYCFCPPYVTMLYLESTNLLGRKNIKWWAHAAAKFTWLNPRKTAMIILYLHLEWHKAQQHSSIMKHHFWISFPYERTISLAYDSNLIVAGLWFYIVAVSGSN